MMHIPIIRRFIYLIVDFKFSLCCDLNNHGVVPPLIDLYFNLSAPNQQMAVLFFTSNMLVKRHSDFLSLGFLTGVGVMVDLGLLLVDYSGVETIGASIISFNCCWSSHLPACLYNFLMF